MSSQDPETPFRAPVRASSWRRATEPLAAREFRRIFTSNICFFMAMGGQSLVRPWLAFELTGSPLALGTVTAAVGLPMLILSPFGGVLADRMERRSLIMWAQALAITSEILTFALLVSGRLQFWHLLVTAASMSRWPGRFS